MPVHRLTALLSLFVLVGFAASLRAQTTVELQSGVSAPFHFAAYGDTRFTDPANTKDSNPAARHALVQAIAEAHPAFITIGGDITLNGYDPNDWNVWESETEVWRRDAVPVYPAIGNHDLHGDQKVALGNYFTHFPQLKGSRYYSVLASNAMLLVLDSSLDELSGPQGEWLAAKLHAIPDEIDFVFLILHHPPYTSSSDEKKFGGGHSARPQEQALAKMLEDRQSRSHARFIVIASHVHNYERHEHGGVIYFVSGGGGAHAYPIERAPGDPFQSTEINYHYLLIEVDRGKATVTMNRLELKGGKPTWTQPDSAVIAVASAVPAKAAAK